jgi:hypothetical protein
MADITKYASIIFFGHVNRMIRPIWWKPRSHESPGEDAGVSVTTIHPTHLFEAGGKFSSQHDIIRLQSTSEISSLR